ncbi:hypothetical protein H8E88_07875 [candidate division KSB1 bacterium]|nr:hypothetical protein [candidate division KSB1 bacterium]
MNTRTAILSIIFFFISLFNLYSQDRFFSKDLFRFNSPVWVQTGGPPGGGIEDVEISFSNPSILYATGSRMGIYKSTNGGDSWQLFSYPEPAHDRIFDIQIDPINPDLIYCDYQNFLKKHRWWLYVAGNKFGIWRNYSWQMFLYRSFG